ncbi:hypothetical protein ACO0LD_05545 [Undibacterium sp. Ji83W]|uniref:hypothetical protein n=1 Tax=Undibacterium sp. Ji83W TaxID=3413043 RepID=UPI003BF2D064
MRFFAFKIHSGKFAVGLKPSAGAKMRSEAVITAIKKITEVNSGMIDTIINNFRGGWEGWLQIETIVELSDQLKPGHAADREVHYPNSTQIADVVLYPRMGNNIYLELKTQNRPNDDILNRFQNDVTKIENQRSANPANVYIAVAFMKTFDRNGLFEIDRASGTSFVIWQFQRDGWKNYINNSSSIKENVNTIAVITYT